MANINNSKIQSCEIVQNAQITKIDFLFYYISNFHNSYFIYFVYFVFVVHLVYFIYFVYSRSAFPAPLASRTAFPKTFRKPFMMDDGAHSTPLRAPPSMDGVAQEAQSCLRSTILAMRSTILAMRSLGFVQSNRTPACDPKQWQI